MFDNLITARERDLEIELKEAHAKLEKAERGAMLERKRAEAAEARLRNVEHVTLENAVIRAEKAEEHASMRAKVLRYVLFSLRGNEEIKSDLCDEVQMAADEASAANEFTRNTLEKAGFQHLPELVAELETRTKERDEARRMVCAGKATTDLHGRELRLAKSAAKSRGWDCYEGGE